MRHTWMLSGLALAVALAGGCDSQQFDEKKAAMRDNWDDSRSMMIGSLAEEAYANGELAQARDRAIEALALDRDNARLRLLLVRIYIEEGSYDEARSHLEVLEESDPHLWEVPYFKGVVFEKQREFGKALTYYDDAHEMSPKAKAPVYAAVEVLAQMGRVDEARQRLDGRLDPNAPDAHGCELGARLAMQAGDYPSAVQHLTMASSVAPDNNRYPEMLAEAHRGMDNHDHVIDVLETHIDRGDYDPPYTVHLMLGEAYLEKRQLRKATLAFEDATEDQPDDPAVWRALASAYLADGQDRQAVNAARRANELDPDDVDGSVLLGYALLRIDRHDQALWTLRQAHSAHPRDVVIICLMGRVLDEQGKDQQAQQLYALASRMDPSASLPRAMLSSSR